MKIIITEGQLGQLIVELHSDAVLLRKMARKSKFNTGKYDGVTVQELINANKQPYLRWVYYNMSMITFMDDILDELNIWPDERIEKPGKNPELGEEISARVASKLPPHKKRRRKSIEDKYKNLQLLKTYGEPFSLEKLALQNQGHSISLYPKKKY